MWQAWCGNYRSTSWKLAVETGDMVDLKHGGHGVQPDFENGVVATAISISLEKLNLV